MGFNRYEHTRIMVVIFIASSLALLVHGSSIPSVRGEVVTVPCETVDDPPVYGDSPVFSMRLTCPIGVEDHDILPRAFDFSPVFPNPLNPSTTISYVLPRSSAVFLAIYDLKGRLIRTLRDGALEPVGDRTATWNGRDDRDRPVAGGTYICRIHAGGYTASQLLTVVK